MVNKDLVKFVKEAKRRGFSDFEIKAPLLERGWKQEEIDEAFQKLSPGLKYKNKISVYLDADVLKIVEKRAKKNLFTVEEQIEDIVRRSCVNIKKIGKEDQKLDDLLLTIFSRRRGGRSK